MFTISNISYYADGKLATDMSSEADWKRQGLYMGPAVSSQAGEGYRVGMVTDVGLPLAV